jgi:hypothetical protein
VDKAPRFSACPLPDFTTEVCCNFTHLLNIISISSSTDVKRHIRLYEFTLHKQKLQRYLRALTPVCCCSTQALI